MSDVQPFTQTANQSQVPKQQGEVTKNIKVPPGGSLSSLLNGSPSIEPLDLASLAANAVVKSTDHIPEQVVCLAIEQDGKQSTVGTLGNITALTGKAKSKKTFVVSFAVAAAVASAIVLKIRGTLPPNRNKVLVFDTEQSRYHVLRIVKRICKLCGIDEPANLTVYSLRPHSPQIRLQIIDWVLTHTAGVGLAVIDGVRDLAPDPILDAEQASQIMTKLLQWTDQLNLHILTVLHQNKGDTNVRGHLGTELVNKAETVISVSRDPTDKNVSIVAPEYCRDREFDEFRFSVDDTGMPFLVGDLNEQFGGVSSHYNGMRTTKPAKPSPDTMSPDTVGLIVQRAFAQEDSLRYSQLRINVIEAADHIGTPLAKTSAEKFIRRVVQQGLITKFKPEKSRHEAYRLPDSEGVNQLS